MFKLKTYIIERLFEACPHAHLKHYHTCNFRNGIGRQQRHRSRHSRRPRGSFFDNNTKGSQEVDLTHNIANNSSNEFDLNFEVDQLYAASSYHDYHSHSQALTILHKQNSVDDSKVHNDIFFKNIRLVDRSYSSACYPVTLINQRRSFATVSDSTDLSLKLNKKLDETTQKHEQDLNNTSFTPIDKEHLIENFTKPIDFKDPVEQMKLFQDLESKGKYNEILANFQFLLNSGLEPTLEIYNKTLNSISLRKNTGESLEENLTSLLNIYSTMLNNDIKPDLTTYTVVLSTLLNGSMRALFESNNFEQGSQYFQVARLLFAVCDHESLTFDQSFYELCLGCYSTFEVVPTDLDGFQLLFNAKLGDYNSTYYLYFMEVYSKDVDKFQILFDNFKKHSLNNETLLSNQFKIYQMYIANLIHTDQLDQATVLLDQILNQIKDQKFFNTVSSNLISTYLETLSIYNVVKTHEIFVMFDSLPWLPDINIDSLLGIMKNCLEAKRYDFLNKFWNYSIIRNDFNSLTSNKNWEDISELLLKPNCDNSLVIDQVIETSLYVDSLNSIRLIKESMLKDITLSHETVMKILNFAIETKQSEAFITNFIINQGYKQSDFNQYLSSIIDLVPQSIQFNLTKSNFFKNCCERYKLINDNFYGIYRNLSITWDCKDIDIVPKLRYYYSVIYNQLNDIDNFYVEIPLELQDFKRLLKLKLDDCMNV